MPSNIFCSVLFYFLSVNFDFVFVGHLFYESLTHQFQFDKHCLAHSDPLTYILITCLLGKSLSASKSHFKHHLLSEASHDQEPDGISCFSPTVFLCTPTASLLWHFMCYNNVLNCLFH